MGVCARASACAWVEFGPLPLAVPSVRAGRRAPAPCASSPACKYIAVWQTSAFRCTRVSALCEAVAGRPRILSRGVAGSLPGSLSRAGKKRARPSSPGQLRYRRVPPLPCPRSLRAALCIVGLICSVSLRFKTRCLVGRRIWAGALIARRRTSFATCATSLSPTHTPPFRLLFAG